VNRDEKAAVIEKVAADIKESSAVIAVDYRGITVKQVADLRARLGEAGTSFRVVKNTLTERAADQAGTGELKAYLEGPTAFAFVHGDAALAAKAIAAFRREHQLLAFKGGVMDGQTVDTDELEAIARLPARAVLQGQFVGVLASPVTGLVRGLGGLLSGIAVALGQVQERGLVGGSAPAATSPTGDAEADPAPADAGDGAAAAGETSEAPGDPVAEAVAAEEESAGEAPPADTEADPAPADAGDGGAEASEAPGDPVAEAVAAEEESADEAPTEGDTTQGES